MNPQLTPCSFWHWRLDELEQDFARIEALLDDDLVKHEAGLGGKFGRRLSMLKARAEKLRQRAQPGDKPTQQLWEDLDALILESRAFCAAQLAFLGGIAITRGASPGEDGFDEGFARRAKDWLVAHRNRLGLDKQISVIVGRGPLWDTDAGLVRVPFPDWDLWHLPLLARALGLLATEPGSEYQSLLETFAVQFIQQPDESLPVDPKQRRDFLKHLFADMLATVLIGPVYAIAVFALEFDYCNPDQLDLEDPDTIEDREYAPRYLPAPVQRAAAILATLETMNVRVSQSRGEQPFDRIVRDLKGLWQGAIQSAGLTDRLDDVTNREQAWHRSLYSEVIEPSTSIAMKQTEKTWQDTLMWQKALRFGQKPANCPPETTALTGAIWLHRLKYPDQAQNALDLANELLRGRSSIVSIQGEERSSERALAQARWERLWTRNERVESILRVGIPAEDRAAVAGRFLRLLSELVLKLEHAQLVTQEEPLRASIWGKLNVCADDSRPVWREALEFFGGGLIRKRGLDCEPAKLAGIAEKGASICDLADALLRDYARRTGVNWSARSVLGADPILTTDTDVVRVRFPDWSPWDLPLMAHEFGHLVARATPAFLQYQSEQFQQAIEGHPHPERANALYFHFDEYFADIFATYTLGPAFACDVILLQFNPAKAYAWRGAHPTHMQRVKVILQALRDMNERAQGEDPFANVLAQLENGWRDVVAACDAVPANVVEFNAQLDQSLRWGRYIYRLIDRFYRLGVCYTTERWVFAQKMSKRLLTLPVPTPDEMIVIAETERVSEVSFSDILNALWHARMSNVVPPLELSAVSQQLMRLFRSRSCLTTKPC